MKRIEYLLTYIILLSCPTFIYSQVQTDNPDTRFIDTELLNDESITKVEPTQTFSPVAGQGEITVLDFEGLGNVDSVNEFYDGGTSGQGFMGEDFNIQFTSGALAVIDSDVGGSGNFANEPSPSTIMVFLDEEPILNALDGFDTGFSFYYSSVTSGGSVTVFDGLDGTGNIIGSTTFDGLGQLPEDEGGDPDGENNIFDIVSVPIDGIGFSILFSGVENQVGFDNITFGSVTPVQTCPPEDVVLRSQEDIDAFAATYPNCTNVPVGIFITEDMATPGDVMDFSPLSFIETIEGHLVFWRVRSSTDFSGFESLTSVGDVLGLNSMPNVTSLNGLQNVESVSWLQVTSMTNLTSLEGFTGLQTIDDRIVISSNRNLGFCSIDPICNLLDAGGSARVFRNGSECNSASDIEANCGTGFRNDDIDLEIVVVPNPVTNEVRIADIDLGENAIITIRNQSGQVVKSLDQFKQKGELISISVSDFREGVYYIHIEDEGQEYSSTFIKQ